MIRHICVNMPLSPIKTPYNMWWRNCVGLCSMCLLMSDITQVMDCTNILRLSTFVNCFNSFVNHIISNINCTVDISDIRSHMRFMAWNLCYDETNTFTCPPYCKPDGKFYDIATPTFLHINKYCGQFHYQRMLWLY